MQNVRNLKYAQVNYKETEYNNQTVNIKDNRTSHNAKCAQINIKYNRTSYNANFIQAATDTRILNYVK